jgi:hypothetical protein
MLKSRNHAGGGWIWCNAYGTAVYIDSNGEEHENTMPTPQGDYGKVYDNLYKAILHSGEKLVSDRELLTNMEILERGFEKASPHVIELKKEQPVGEK